MIAASLLGSCSGYLSENGVNTLPQVEKIGLAMEGGGYLSTASANEITPFLFRDSSTGNAYLFFASDRDGSYAIYYAQMDSSGKFFNLAKMGLDINQPRSTNFSPVVFKAGGVNYIAYLTVNTNIFFNPSNNILTYALNGSFATNSTGLAFNGVNGSTNYSQISVYTSSAGTVYLQGAYGSFSGGTSIQQYYFNTATGAPNWTFSSIIEVSSLHYSTGEFVTTSGPSTNMYILYDNISGSKHQLGGEVYSFGTTTNTTAFSIKDYASSANDAFPYIDTAGGYKVYFASDRAGNGNYDLYRYNILTYDKEVPSSLREGF